jgi:hypothetical protein
MLTTHRLGKLFDKGVQNGDVRARVISRQVQSTEHLRELITSALSYRSVDGVQSPFHGSEIICQTGFSNGTKRHIKP